MFWLHHGLKFPLADAPGAVSVVVRMGGGARRADAELQASLQASLQVLARSTSMKYRRQSVDGAGTADVILPCASPSSSAGRVGAAAPAGQPHPGVLRQRQDRQERQLVTLCESGRLCA